MSLKSFSFIYLIYRILTCKEGKIFAIKEYIAHIYLKYFHRQAKSRCDHYDYNHPSDLKLNNVLPPDKEVELENRTTNDPTKRDGLFVFGYNSKGEHLVARITIQGNKAKVWIQFKVNGKLYTLPRERLWNVPKTEANCFAAAGLRLKCLTPFRKCRVSFNGLLREERSNKDVHVKFSFIWTASAEPFDHKTISNNILEKYLAETIWNSWLPNTGLLPTTPDVLDESGNLTGTFIIEGGEENEMLLWGARIRSFENSENEEKLKEYFVYMSQEGEYIHITDTGKFLYGFIIHSNSEGGEVEKLNIEHQPNEQTEAKFTFSRGKNDFTLIIKSSRDNVNSVSDVEFATDRTYVISNAILNDDENGFSIIVETRQNAQFVSQYKEGLSIADTTEPVLKISDDRCKNVQYSGGKGSSLAQLKDISRSNSSFTVPSGFVVTTLSYQKFMDINNVKEVLKNFALEDVAWGNVEGDLKSVCQKIVSQISNMELPTSIKTHIEANLKEYDNSTLFAVRSSASGEDSEEMSAAGQMETYLGVQGLDSILKAIAKCWASQFSHTAIQYKKQNGQELNSPMAVVVQEMIAAEQAGVMFTCHPLTGNPGNITITANYGLGESVVSATAEPDTILVKRDAYGNVEIDSVEIGRKSKKTILANDGGVTDEEVSLNETGKCCLSNEIALKLAKLGHEVEESYGCPLDIEWAVVKNSIYLLQARPVTTFDRETDYELIHESDAHLRSEFETFSKANVGEVLPGATTELAFNFLIKLMEISMQNHWTRKPIIGFKLKSHTQADLVVSSKHVLFNITDTFYRMETKQGERNIMVKAYEIGIFGRILDDEELKQRAIRRNKYYPSINWKVFSFLLFKDFLNLNKNLKRDTKFINEHKITLNKNTTAEEYLYQILQELFKISKYTQAHGLASMSSNVYNSVALSVLAKANKGEWNEVVFGDFAKLVASCKEVESANVPYALQVLAATIKECIEPEKFREMSIEKALEWLQTSGTEASKKFREFLTKHGHRCLKEFDLETLPWRVDPNLLVKSLQEMTKSANKPKKATSIINDTINSLKTKLNWKSRLILRLVVPFCETAVGRREQSKSTFIKTIDHFRKEFYTFADKMVQEGRLPDKKLVFFLNIHELVQLLQTRSPKLIQKAIRRKNLHLIVDAYRFPEIMKGLAKPINADKPLFEHVEGDLTLKGTPVSQGVVKGRVRVANNLEEAALLQPGEILVAYSTDIGWSPYFPILAGVVTELGGLVSHGAVVAREYGLPCVVALHGATVMFKTGEMAILDGNKGTLQRVLE